MLTDEIDNIVWLKIVELSATSVSAFHMHIAVEDSVYHGLC